VRASSSRSTASKKKKKPSALERRRNSTAADTATKALKQYEDGLKAFRKGDYAKAIPHFEGVLGNYAVEREICDRTRMWLTVARLRAGGSSPKLENADDYYYQGVLEVNDGRLEDAVRMFESVISRNAESDKAHYALAAVCGIRNDAPGATRHLSRAIEINAANRVHALNDADFDALREDAEFMALLGKTPEGDR
jgi:tetratricopeptide (TPR) repeat protein